MNTQYLNGITKTFFNMGIVKGWSRSETMEEIIKHYHCLFNNPEKLVWEDIEEGCVVKEGDRFFDASKKDWSVIGEGEGGYLMHDSLFPHQREVRL